MNINNYILELTENTISKGNRLSNAYCLAGDIILKIKLDQLHGREVDLEDLIKNLEKIQKITKA